jgi:small subunit ribosomal protein S20
MPIIKSAKKRVKQSEKARKRNYPVRTKMKTGIKKVLDAVKDGDKKKAEDLLSKAYKIIDTAAKKNIIHKNNAARKKSMLARRVDEMNEENEKPKEPAKKKPSNKKPAKQKESKEKK